MIDFILSTIENEEQRNKLSEFYKKYNKRFFSIALSKLHSEIDAEDAAQEVFSEISDKPEKIFEVDPEGRLAYTDIMVRNVAIEMFKSKQKTEYDELDEEIEDHTILLEDTVLANVEHDEILFFMKQLPVEQKNVLLLHCYFDLTISETSQRLHISATTVNRRLLLARKAIKKFIEERNANCE